MVERVAAYTQAVSMKSSTHNYRENLKTVKALTEEELKAHLLTCDYRGREFKTLVLDELLERKYDQAYDDLRTQIDA